MFLKYGRQQSAVRQSVVLAAQHVNSDCEANPRRLFLSPSLLGSKMSEQLPPLISHVSLRIITAAAQVRVGVQLPQ